MSIHVISFNQKKYIEQCLLSALNQDFDLLEVVISDDCSTDGTQEIIKEIHLKFPKRLKPLFNKNRLGITKNANRALSFCRGKYIAVLGGDDYFLPNKITKQFQYLEDKENYLLCGHKIKVQFDNNSSLNFSDKILSKDQISPGISWSLKNAGPPFATMTIMYRRDAIPKYGFDERYPYCSDWKLFLDVIGCNGHYGYLEEALAVYRRHESNSTNLKNILRPDQLAILEEIKMQYPFLENEIIEGKQLISYLSGVLEYKNMNFEDASKFALICHNYKGTKKNKALLLYLLSILRINPNTIEKLLKIKKLYTNPLLRN